MSKLGYFSGSSEMNNVSMFLDKIAKKNPHRVVLQWVKPETLKSWDFNLQTPLIHEKLTIGPFTEMIARTAQGLLELGLTKGDRVILFIPMNVSLYVAMSALQRIGAIPVFLDSWARRSHLGVSAQCVSPKAMISFEKAFQLVADVPELQNLAIKVVAGPHQGKYSARLEELMQHPTSAPIIPVEMEHTALITFTTGSSGAPKGANRTHRFLAAQHYALDHSVPYQEGDIDLPAFPIFSLNNIASGINTVLPALDVGVPGEHDPLMMLAQFKECGVNCATLSPSLLNRLSSYCLQQKIQLPNMRRLLTGGAPISRDNLIDIKQVTPNAEVWVLYGSTEAEPMAHIEATEMINFKSQASHDPEYVDEGVNVGHTAEGLEYKFIKIYKDAIQINSPEAWRTFEVTRGEVGELIVAGEHVCRDYYNNPEAFKKSKILDHRGVVWHRTGDLGYMDAQEYLWIVGRVHNAIHRLGKYHFPVRAEVVLAKLDFVKNAAYVGIADEKFGEKTFVVVSCKEKISNDLQKKHFESEIHRLFAKNNMPVDKVVFLSEIPMDPRHHSKVEYDVLREELRRMGLDKP